MYSREIKERLQSMTIEEKARLCAGKDFWQTWGDEGSGIPPMLMTDGPSGLRKQTEATDHLGLNESNTAVCFPAGCALASSFDPDLAEAVGTEIGKLARAENVGVVLGPSINIKRSPLCGRSFEYYSEDPYVSGKIAVGFIKGIQNQGVGASPKHFLANNQEYYRQTSNSVVDEVTMREIYLPAFEMAVKDGKPWTVMCSYNRVNGTYACENSLYLTDILRSEWGFDGVVVTDWGACNDPVESLQAGLDLEMPGPARDNVRRIEEAVKDGKVKMEILDRAVGRVLDIQQRAAKQECMPAYDFELGHAAAQKAAEESAVLLKNEEQILPLKKEDKILFIGEYADKPRYQGGGSSHIHPYRVTSAKSAVADMENITFAQGYCDQGKNNDRLLREAAELAKYADKVVIFAGLPEYFESEGLDRNKMDMPEYQNHLICEVAKVNPNMVVVLHNGAPVTMPWVNQVKGILELYLAGEAAGEAAVRLLFGDVNPSGHLAETFPLRVEDTPVYPYYGREKEDIIYREGLLVGYRYYGTVKKETLFAFGHGLSYSEFRYSNLQLDRREMTDCETLHVSVDVENISDRTGKALVQIYVEPLHGVSVRPVRELRAFEKTELKSGEKKKIHIRLDRRAFAQWDKGLHDWYVPEGSYAIQIGASAEQILHTAEVKVKPKYLKKERFTINSPMGDFKKSPKAMKLMGQFFPQMQEQQDEDIEDEFMNKKALEATSNAMPLRAMLSFAPGLTYEMLEQLVEAVNREGE